MQIRTADRSLKVTRAVFALARRAGFTPDQIAAIGGAGATLDRLRRARADTLARTAGIDLQQAVRLIEAARLTRVPGVSAPVAFELVDRQITERALRETTVEQLRQKVRDLPDASHRVLDWVVRSRVGRSRMRSLPKTLAAPRPMPGEPAVGVRRLVLENKTDWPSLARDLYGARGASVEKLAVQLAAANQSDLQSRLDRGTTVLLPATKTAHPKLPDPARAAAALQSFAPHLSSADASALVDAGIVVPRQIVAAGPVARIRGIPPNRWQQLQVQALLAGVRGMSPEVAHYLAAHEPRSLRTLTETSAAALAIELRQAQALGLIPTDVVLDDDTVGAWMVGILEVLVDWGVVIVWERPDEGLCEQQLPPDTHLENFYAYRFAPGGMSSSALGDEIAFRDQWLAEVDAYLSGPEDVARTRGFAERGLGLGRLGVPDLKHWFGLGEWSLDTREMLSKLRDFLRSNLRVLQLLQPLTEGHEAYRHREYGLALAAYGRARRWFDANASEDLQNQLWWENVDDASGAPIPAFVRGLQAAPGDAVLTRLETYYSGRLAGSDPETLLQALQVDVPDYHRWPLFPMRRDDWSSHPERGLPFGQYLYYVARFMLPMLEADCYNRLGNYCAALERYFEAHHEPAFTAKLDNSSEQRIAAVRVSGPAPGALVAFAVTPSSKRYHPAFLNGVERRLVALRVAETCLAWADSLYRQRDTQGAAVRYAQALRVHFGAWQTWRTAAAPEDAAATARQAGLNPRALEISIAAQNGLTRIGRGLNYLGYRDDHVPVWTYGFLVSSARYFAERARQLGRDALQFLGAAEQEEGNRRLLHQAVAIGDAQLAVESRRVDEAQAAIDLAEAGASLAAQQLTNATWRRTEFEAFAPMRQALGIVGGAVSGAGAGGGIGGAAGGLFGQSGGPIGAVTGMPIGAGYGAISSYLSGAIELQAQRNELIRQQLELQGAAAMAQAEVARAQVGKEVALLTRHVAALNAAFTRSNLAYAEAKTLNAEFWYETSLRLADMAAAQLERAIGLAFLAEQAFEFMDGRRLDVIRFDYGQTEGVLAADALLSDLDSIEYERITGRQSKTMPVKHVIRLREKDFARFTEFKRTGSITVDVPLFELDMAHPGSYQQRIAAVEVEIRALVPPQGLRGTLRKAGLSFLRYRSPRGLAPAPNTAPDWIQHTPVDFRIAPVIQAPEVFILSPFDLRRDGVVLRPDAEQLRAFEGSGVATTWTFSLPACANEFDLGSVTDVDLVVYCHAQFDEELERAVQLERRKLLALGRLPLQRSRGFSLREAFPDAFYHLHNPPAGAAFDPWQRREVALEIPAGVFPPNQMNRRLEGVTLAFAGSRGYIEVAAGLASADLALAPASFQPTADNPRIKVAAGNQRAPEGTWQLSFLAADNPNLARAGLFKIDAAGRVALDAARRPVPDAGGSPIFDEARIAEIEDVWLIFNYAYDQAGDCGEPLTLWSHFGGGAQVWFPRNGAAVSTSWVPGAATAVDAWRRLNGVFRHTVSAATGLSRPAEQDAWRDVAVSGDVELPSSANRAAGLAVRYRAPTDPRTAFYLGRLTRLSGNRLEAAIELRQDGSTRVLASAALDALGAEQRFSLAFRARGDALELRVNGRPVVQATDATLESGVIGLYAAGDGVGFAEVLASNLKGR